jgi:hypothetical protein
MMWCSIPLISALVLSIYSDVAAGIELDLNSTGAWQQLSPLHLTFH